MDDTCTDNEPQSCNCNLNFVKTVSLHTDGQLFEQILGDDIYTNRTKLFDSDNNMIC